MAGTASGGQTLTPNRNVNAPAGFGGDLWGANGGGITPIGGGVTGQKGWDERVAATISNAQTVANYLTQGRLSVVNPANSGVTGTVASILHLSNGILDTAIPAPIWTAGGTNGTATINNGQFQFGVSSLLISGTDAWINTPDIAGSAIDLSSVANFTVDCWVYPSTATQTNASANGNSVIFDITQGLSQGFRLWLNSTGGITVQGFGSGGWLNVNATTSNTVTLNAWNHVMFERIGLTTKIGLNGTITNSTALTGNGNFSAPGANQFAYIGASGNSNIQHTAWASGFIEEFRIITGQAFFGSGATYTVPSAPMGDPSFQNLPVPPPAVIPIQQQTAIGALSQLAADSSLANGNSFVG